MKRLLFLLAVLSGLGLASPVQALTLDQVLVNLKIEGGSLQLSSVEISLAQEAAKQTVQKGASPDEAYETVSYLLKAGVRGNAISEMASAYGQSRGKKIGHRKALKSLMEKVERERGKSQNPPGGKNKD